MASDATFIWNGGTASYSSTANWTIVPGSSPNPANVPASDDDAIIPSGDVQYIDTLLPGLPDFGGARGLTTLQSGQIDMINSGTSGSAGLAGDAGGGAATLLVTNTIAAVSTLTSSGGSSTNGGTIDVDANGNLTFSILSGNASNNGLIETTNGGTLVIQSSPGATFSNLGSFVAGTGGVGGQVVANSGSILVTATIGSSAGYFGLQNGGQIEINTPIPGSGAFDFIDGNTDVLKLDQLDTFNGSIIEFGSGDTVDLGGINVGTIVYDGNLLTLEGTTGATLAVLNAPTMFGADNGLVPSGTSTVTTDGTTSSGDLIFGRAGNGDLLMAASPITGAVACFATGTRIATPDGPVAVEDLNVGDTVHTVVSDKPQAIVWIGHRRVDCARHPSPEQAWPIRITAGAFGRDQPARDVWLSPDHAVYVDGVLIPVKYLVNDASIVQVRCDSVTYYHIELTRHDVVLADGLAAESYLSGADRSVFANHAGPVSMHPDFASRVWEAEGCAELIITGPVLDAVRARLDRVAARRQRSRKRAA